MTQIDRAKLQDVMDGIAAGDAAALQQLYHLTSDRLFGKLFALLGDHALAARALKQTYLHVWEHRTQLSGQNGLEFQQIAAIAHQNGLNIRFSLRNEGHSVQLESPLKDGKIRSASRPRPGELHEQDFALLKAAYLEACDPNVLAETFGMSATEVRSRLAALASGKGGHANE
ncbi:hypothetical protein WNY37_16470 [Henriciella sp. AS95]|uniref:hypothetical protein n=1 Tax=Henriciella sp. AS95 TaxID=3135782 RepID=UPI0031786CD4